MMKRSTLAGVAAGTIVISGLFAMNMQPKNGYTNLKVLPLDISRNELGNVMFGNVVDLGLPVRGGEGCLYCHIGDMNIPRNKWDFASDEKVTKRKARSMMEMVKSINEDYLGKLEARIDRSFKVTCASCHAGRPDPRPLSEVIWEAFEVGGAESASTKYRDLRTQHYGGNAYDFRPQALVEAATRIANESNYDAAIAITELNIEFNPQEAALKKELVTLKLERTVVQDGVEKAIAEVLALEPKSNAPQQINSLARRMLQSNRIHEGRALIEANYAKFPDVYVANESMAVFSAQTGQVDEGIAILERWLEINPNHKRAQSVLANLRGG
jgi:Photosynthetic reaction centre cytochrome C subunit